MTDPVLRWPAVTKDPDDTKSVSLGLWTLCAPLWEPNEQVFVGDFMWPRVVVSDGQIVKGPNGFVAECTQAGRTGAKEPRWAPVADQVMAGLDGSVGWTYRVGDLQGIQEITAATVNGITPVDLSFQTSTVVINEATKLLVDYLGGTLDASYEIEFRFVIAGRTRVGRQIVTIAKK